MPKAIERRWLVRRAAWLAVYAALVVLLVSSLPGLDSLRARFTHAGTFWVVLAGLSEGASVIVFGVALHRAFAPRLRRRSSALLAVCGQAVNALIPSGGTSGMAAISVVLARAGLPRRLVIGRMVALFVLTDVFTNVGLVTLGGLGLTVGLLHGHTSTAASAIPGTVGAILLVALLIVLRGRLRDPVLLGASALYVLFDLAALACSFRAVGGAELPLGTLLLAYTLGQVGSVLPLPGTTEGGLLGAFVLYGAGVGVTLSAILIYRAAQTLVSLALGAVGALAGRNTLFADPGSALAIALPAVQGPRPPG